MAVSTLQLPHGLQLVIDFVNTFDLDQGTEELDTPTALAEWLQSRGLLNDPVRALGTGQLAEAIELREALRAVMLSHNGGDRDPQSARRLERAAERSGLSVRFAPDGSIGIAPRVAGFHGALGSLLAPVAQAAGAGTWARVKACRAEDCQWAFYDRSRNHAGRWCDMAVCGNRTKVRAYRTKQGSDAADP